MRAIAVIDGEHYAPVVRDALAVLPYEFVAVWLAGGTEKLRGGDDYGVPVVDELEAAIAELEPEVVGTHVDVWRKYTFHGQERIIQFSTETKTYEKYTARIEAEVRST